MMFFFWCFHSKNPRGKSRKRSCFFNSYLLVSFWRANQGISWQTWAVWSKFGACLFNRNRIKATTCSEQRDREWLLLHYLSLSIWFDKTVSLQNIFWSYSNICYESYIYTSHFDFKLLSLKTHQDLITYLSEKSWEQALSLQRIRLSRSRS